MAGTRAVVSPTEFIRVCVAERSKYEKLDDAAAALGMRPASLYQKVLTWNRTPEYVNLQVKPYPSPDAKGTGRGRQKLDVASLAALFAAATQAANAADESTDDESTADESTEDNS